MPKPFGNCTKLSANIIFVGIGWKKLNKYSDDNSVTTEAEGKVKWINTGQSLPLLTRQKY